MTDDIILSCRDDLRPNLNNDDCLLDYAPHPTAARALSLDAPAPWQPMQAPAAKPKLLQLELVGFHCLSRECLIEAVRDVQPEILTTAFVTPAECLSAGPGCDIIVFFLHGNDVTDASILQSVTPLCQATSHAPVIVFSDADQMHQSRIMRAALKAGAMGFVATQTASLAVTLAAIRFVQAGGTFVPADLLLTTRPDGKVASHGRLTARQSAVLHHLARGTPNKIIAYELGMSESTVKVHVRNIMRKMGATNRTEAAYKAQRQSADYDDAGAARL